MPITFDNAGGTYTTGAALSFVYTAAAAATLVAFVGTIDVVTTGASQSAILTYAGVALTKLGVVQGVATTVPLSVWALSAPASGANTLSATFAANVNWEIMLVSYTGVKAISGFGTVGAATGVAATELKISLSSTSTDIVVSCFQATGATGITITNGTQRFTTSGTGAPAVWAIADQAGAAPVTASASFSGANAPFGIGVPLLFSAVAAGSIPSLSLLGAGF